MKSIEQFINKGTQNNEEVIDYWIKLYKRYTRKYSSNNCSIADSDRIGYIIPELEKIFKHFKIKVK